MKAQARALALICLAGVMLSMPATALGLDAEALKLVAGELPFPSLNFELGVKFSVRQTGLIGIGEPAEALEAADERLAANPADAAARLQRGMALEALGREDFEEEYSRAVELWKQAVADDPEDQEARLGLAKAQVQMEAFEEAAPLVRELTQKRPDLWWPHHALARQTMAEFLDAVDWSDLSKLRPLAESEGDDPEAFHMRMQQIADTALMHIQQALEASPGEPAPRVLRALIRMQVALWGAVGGQEPPGLELFADVSDEFRELARDCPDEPQIQVFARWTTITQALSRLGGGQDLSGLWHRLPPDDQRRLAEDELATDAMVSEESGRIPDAYELLAVYAMLHGNDTGAIDRLKESVQQDPTSPERWEAYVGAITRSGDLAKIEQALREAQEHVDSGKFRAALAKVYQKRGEADRAEQELLAVIEATDEYAPFAQLMVGLLRLKHDNAQGAVGPLQAAAETWKEDGLAEAALAVALSLTGKQQEAAEHIAKACEMQPDATLYQRAAEIIGA